MGSRKKDDSEVLSNKVARRYADNDNADEIRIHLWERNGEIRMRVLWLQRSDQRQVCSVPSRKYLEIILGLDFCTGSRYRLQGNLM